MSSASYSKTIIVGNLGKDPVARFTSSGKKVVSFNVAVNTKRGEDKFTTWYKCTAWEKTAENVEKYLKKGSSVLVEGTLQSDKETGGPVVYEKKDGGYGAGFELTAFTVTFLGGAEGSGKKASEGGDYDEVEATDESEW